MLFALAVIGLAWMSLSLAVTGTAIVLFYLARKRGEKHVDDRDDAGFGWSDPRP